MSLSGRHFVLVICLFSAGLWGYGYMLATSDLEEGLSILEASFTHKSLNPLSAMGYKNKLNNSKMWQNHLNRIRCEQENRHRIDSLYSRETHGNNWYKYQSEAIERANQSCH